MVTYQSITICLCYRSKPMRMRCFRLASTQSGIGHCSPASTSMGWWTSHAAPHTSLCFVGHLFPRYVLGLKKSSDTGYTEKSSV